MFFCFVISISKIQKSIACLEKDKTTYIYSKIDNIGSQYGLYQLINEPTHSLENSSSSSGIDLIFTSQLILVLKSGFHSSYMKILIIS